MAYGWWPKDSPLINDNIIQDNRHGIIIQGTSSPTIENNTFIRNSDFAIGYENETNPKISNNTFIENEFNVKEIEYGWGLLFFQMCGIIMIFLTIFLFVILRYIQKRAHRGLDMKESNRLEDNILK